MKRAKTGFLLGLVMALVVQVNVGADTVISTLGNPELGTDNNSDTNSAMQFTTGNQAESLQSVTVDLLAATGTTRVTLLYNLPFATPGPIALQLGSITPTGPGFSNYTLNAPSTFTLAANTTYWVELTYQAAATPQTPGSWAYTNADPPSGPGYTVTGSGTNNYFAESFDEGTTWNVESSAVNGPYIFAVNGTSSAVPEPSTFFSTSIAVIAGIGVAIRRTHRKKKADDTIQS